RLQRVDRLEDEVAVAELFDILVEDETRAREPDCAEGAAAELPGRDDEHQHDEPIESDAQGARRDAAQASRRREWPARRQGLAVAQLRHCCLHTLATRPVARRLPVGGACSGRPPVAATRAASWRIDSLSLPTRQRVVSPLRAAAFSITELSQSVA